jgi:cyclase
MMRRQSNFRLIPRLDIKGPNLIKGVHLEGLRVVGEPSTFAKDYYKQGADEIIFMDAVASLYGRNNLSQIVRRAVEEIFVPITVGGGVRSISDVTDILRAGADKIALNTAAINRPTLIEEIATQFGSQSVVLSVEAKQVGAGKWEALTDGGREKSGLDVVEWVTRAIDLGAGEILLTSVDHEGTRRGFDLPLIRAVSAVASIPLIASGGMGVPEDALSAYEAGADAVAMARVLHYREHSIPSIRRLARSNGLLVRPYE